MKSTDLGKPSDLDELMALVQRLRNPEEVMRMLHSVVRHKNIGPYNAMLIYFQRPDAERVMSGTDWRALGRFPKSNAAPLLILKPFSPVGFVFDYRDTEGKDLPEDHQLSLLGGNAFGATGSVSDKQICEYYKRCGKIGIKVRESQQKPHQAGKITKLGNHDCVITINDALPPCARFATLCHELAHLYCGHLGICEPLGVKSRNSGHSTQEAEAELVAFLVGKRMEVDIASAEYLMTHFLASKRNNFSLDAVIKAAGNVEATLLGKMWRKFKNAQPRKS